MALPSRPQPAVLRPPLLCVLAVALSACAGAKAKPTPTPAASRHTAHGHAIAMVEQTDGGSDVMLERVEDEDTRWVELPHFGECPYDPDDIPPYKPVDDGHVPGLAPERSRLTNMDAGEETIHNEALLQLLDHATTEVLRCISVSACYDDRALEPGSIDLLFEVAPNGDVRGVDVEPTASLDHTGVRECARVAIWDTHFPAFDGADMVVNYSLDID
ncbi:MAG: hypothetical protein K0V04_26660 [Deltaproteobacteria bacterium]|nr:hypothetical protein [Deltaproteobacteria bacterium]